VKKYIDEELAKGTIEPSKSPCASPVLIVRKPNGGLRVCMDYRALNAITVKDRYPIPLIKETLDRLCKAQIFTRLDIVAAFNNMRIREGDEYMTAFITRYGLYQYKVLPFGLCNGPASWQRYMNSLMPEFLDEFVTIYLDDLLIYSENLDSHIQHVRKVLLKLRAAGIPADIDKCEFHVQEVKYLGLILTPGGLKMDPSKVDAIQSWEEPKCVKDVQSFLGFANFYRRFIRNYSAIAGPMTALTKKDIGPFVFNDNAQAAFKHLKGAFLEAPIMAHYNPEPQNWVETDASNYVVAGVLSQMHGDVLKPVAFFSKRMVPAECNYDIYDKELLAIIRAFEEWRPELVSAAHENQAITDHRNLQSFMSTKQLNPRQARWAEFLSQFHFRITYRPGKQGEKPDALTRRPQDWPTDTDDPRIASRNRALLRPENIAGGMLTKATRDLNATPLVAVGLALIASEHDTYLDLELASLTSSNPFSVLEDNDDSEGAVQLPNEHLESDSVDDNEDEPTPLQDVLRTAYDQSTVKQHIAQCKQPGNPDIVPEFLKTLRAVPADCSFVTNGTMLMVNGRLT
jgi:hypothetical protein